MEMEALVIKGCSKVDLGVVSKEEERHNLTPEGWLKYHHGKYHSVGSQGLGLSFKSSGLR